MLALFNKFVISIEVGFFMVDPLMLLSRLWCVVLNNWFESFSVLGLYLLLLLMNFLFSGGIHGVLLFDGRLLCHCVTIYDEFGFWQFTFLLSLFLLPYYFRLSLFLLFYYCLLSLFILFWLQVWLGLFLLFLFNLFHLSIDFLLLFQQQLSFPL